MTAPAGTDRIAAAEIAIWGLGLIGYTLAGRLARSGRRCLVADVDAERVDRLNRGLVPFRHLPSLADDHHAEVAAGRIRATTAVDELLTDDHPVHVVCVPTERDGEVDASALRTVARQVAGGAARPVHFLVESTIAPSWLDSVVHAEFAAAGRVHGVDYHVGASPRRDWLTSGEHTMASLTKIVGGDSPEACEVLRALYEPVCGEVVTARDAKHAAMVKVVENYFRYRDIMLANELAGLLPQYDLTSVLRQAGTKWNMQPYHPSLGIGGYCVPLAKDYLGEEAGAAAFAGELAAEEEKLFARAREAVRGHGRFRTVAVLGIAYAPGMRIHTRSPGVRLARELAAEGRTVLVHDPLYSPEELTAVTGCPALSFPDDLRVCDSVLVMTDHDAYRDVDHGTLLDALGADATVVDNLGTWSDRGFGPLVHYTEVGGSGFFDGAAAHVPGRDAASARGFVRDAGARTVLDGAARVAAIDRRYLRVTVDSVEMSMAEVAALVASLRECPPSTWTDGRTAAMCALYAVDVAGVRLEQVGITADLDTVAAELRAAHDAYRAKLGPGDGPAVPPARDLPWWDVAAALPRLRGAIDRRHVRLLEIDGRTWHRTERTVPSADLRATPLPAPLAAELAARHPAVTVDASGDVPSYLRRLTRAEVGTAGSPVGLLETVMSHATRDPRHLSDHATLMCPRGTGLDRPGSLTKADIGVLVVFHPGFAPDADGPVGDRAAIRRAMYAHHAAKKVRVAHKVYRPDDTYVEAALTDDLGTRGIFFHEDAHHRGHVLAGVSSAMRSLMAITVVRDGREHVVHDLCDWRLTRVSGDPRHRYSPADYGSFFLYGHWLRAVVEAAIDLGAPIPAMLGEWR